MELIRTGCPPISVKHFNTVNPFPATEIRRALRFMRRPTVYRSRKLRRLSARPPSTQTSLPLPRRKMLAMWPVRVV